MSSVLSFETQNTQKNGWKKIVEKVKKEPLVPVVKSVLATCLAFLGATIAIQRKNKLLANRMFRYRVYAQGFTLAIMVAGNIYYRSMMQQNTQS
ncbi:uncharacterized protein T551_00386 [Pneumocystis jirovecii RU7]|uniref:HIG1 domain-containing protein n=1 Tax=Pneumocystis jirovecii (strain RU7) TaxID=1408657 RepID=A0A0W4ZV86_PNEJ7|nr:uncharacterized protein T551_00386 [Pneumocystis jirovecii RU7]KTW32295.1 hypothetical protein T551_00386 [Pneumocystis jirovecii RU7]